MVGGDGQPPTRDDAHAAAGRPPPAVDADGGSRPPLPWRRAVAAPAARMTGLRDAQTVATAQARLAELLAGEPLEPVRPLGAGLDHAAYLLGDVVVRFPARDGAEEAPDPRREAATGVA